MTKYALFHYTTMNVGDEIQSIAARRFLPRVDYYINRDFMNQFKSDDEEEIKIIMNGWYAHFPDNIYFNDDHVHPLLTSVFVSNDAKASFSTGERFDFLKRHEPIGARNMDTKEYFESIGIQSYFSGCLTLTLEKEPTIQKRDFILAVDIPKEVLEKVRSESQYPVIDMTPVITHHEQSIAGRLKLAEYFLYLYQSARCVITSRLHATLPCLALETPVLNIDVAYEPERFAVLRELAHHMTVEQYLAGGYDVNHPLPNPDTYRPIRERLIEECRQYTGYDSPYGFLHGQSLLDFWTSPELTQVVMQGLQKAAPTVGW